LRREGQVGYFIQEERAAMRQLKQAALGRDDISDLVDSGDSHVSSILESTSGAGTE